MRNRCPSGKRGYQSYGEALATLDRLAAEGILSGPFGTCYRCPHCEVWHVSSRRFVVAKAKGRGKRRRGLVIEEGA